MFATMATTCACSIVGSKALTGTPGTAPVASMSRLSCTTALPSECATTDQSDR